MHPFENALLFKCIVEKGSLSKAAIDFSLNTSAVSKRLQKLEHSLGTQLIQRTTRSLTLTHAGQAFYERVCRLQHDWQSAIDETTSYGKEIKGKLTIAAPQPLLSRFLLEPIAQFKRKYPNIELEILNVPMDQLPNLAADVSISRELEDYDSQTISIRPFFHYSNALFASPEYLLEKPLLSFNEIQEHTCLSYPNIEDWHFIQESTKLPNRLIVNSAETMIACAKKGLGLVYLPKEILTEELEQKALLPVLPEYQSEVFRTCIYYLKVQYLPLKTRIFIDFLCDFWKQ